MKDVRLMTGLSFMLALLMFNCSTPSNLLQEGDYDEAVYTAIKNLRKKKKKREKDIIVVEEAFRKITARDMNQIAALEAEGQAANWVRINKLHNDIKNRQELISPYLPLVATKTRYKADFRFVKILPLEIASRKKAAEYYYQLGMRKMEDARNGDKGAARSAHKKFTLVRNYFETYKDNLSLLDDAYEMGLDKVILEMRNSSFAIIPLGFEDALLAFNERNLDDFWTHYYKAHNAPADIDYKVIIDLTDIDVSPERYDEKFYTLTKTLEKIEKKEVEKLVASTSTSADKKNAEGKVVSNTNPETVTVIKEVKVPYTVSADVIDTYQTKSAFVNARVSFYDAASKTLIDSDYVSSTIDFENIASTFIGDKRALTNAVKCRLGGAPVRFPSDSELVFDAADQLKGKLTRCIRQTDMYVLR